jgi:hypothetical protein
MVVVVQKLKDLKEEMKSQEEATSVVKSSIKLLERFKSGAQDSKKCLACCRKFASEDELDVAVRKLTQMIKSVDMPEVRVAYSLLVPFTRLQRERERSWHDCPNCRMRGSSNSALSWRLQKSRTAYGHPT